MLDGGIITGLLTIVGAGSFIGEEVAKEAIKHYAPKAFSRLDETIESIWSSVRSGDVKEAERQVEESGLAETIVTSAAELQRQTVVLSVPEMENEYVSRVRALEKAVNYAFELSRRWKIDLLLPGGLSDACELTLFKTDKLPSAKFQYLNSDLGFKTTGEDRIMWVLTKDKAGNLSSTELLTGYRDSVVKLRQQSNNQYFSIFSKISPSFVPVLFVDGGAMNTFSVLERQWKLIDNDIWTFEVKNYTRVSIDSWSTGIARMEEALRDMPTWLRLSATEKAALQERLQ